MALATLGMLGSSLFGLLLALLGHRFSYRGVHLLHWLSLCPWRCRAIFRSRPASHFDGQGGFCRRLKPHFGLYALHAPGRWKRTANGSASEEEAARHGGVPSGHLSTDPMAETLNSHGLFDADCFPLCHQRLWCRRHARCAGAHLALVRIRPEPRSASAASLLGCFDIKHPPCLALGTSNRAERRVHRLSVPSTQQNTLGQTLNALAAALRSCPYLLGSCCPH